jgi:DNA-directed RNA polymerase
VRQGQLRARGDASSAGSDRDLLLDAVAGLGEVVEYHMAKAARPTPGATPEVPELLLKAAKDDFSPYIVAFTALRVLFDRISAKDAQYGGGAREQDLAWRIGAQVRDEMLASSISDEVWLEIEKRVRQLDRHDRSKLLAEGLRRSRTTASASKWDSRQIDRIGKTLLGMALDYTELLERDEQRELAWKPGGTFASKAVVDGEHSSTTVRYRLRQEVIDYLRDRDMEAALRERVWLPMIEPPVIWTHARGGGYHTENYPLLGHGESLEQLELAQLEGRGDVDLREVYAALNSLASTPFTVNRRVLEVAEYFRYTPGEAARRGISAGLGIQGGRPIPPGPDPTPREAAQRRKARRRFRFSLPRGAGLGIPGDRRIPPEVDPDLPRDDPRRIAVDARRRESEASLKTARDLLEAGVDEFWLPRRLDFRGRVYAIPTTLSADEGDLCRALLRFTAARPLGDQSGIDALLIHYANTAGKDKENFEERLKWAHAHLEDAKAVAADPLANVSIWHRADGEPWQHLAACFEVAQYVAHVEAGGDRFEFLSALPVPIDATCSGIQHLSLMMRDSTGGSAVNLLPSQDRQDVYGDVARVLTERLESIAARDNKAWRRECAQDWLDSDLISRKLVKVGAMAFSYGITRSGIAGVPAAGRRKKRKDRRGIYHELNELRDLEGKELPWPRAADQTCAQFFANQLYGAIEDVLELAPRAMQYIQGLAEILAQCGHDFIWTSPVGMTALRRYRKPAEIRVTTHLSGEFPLRSSKMTTIDRDAPIGRRPIDLDKAKNASAPNFVHSYDSAHLVRAVSAFATASGGAPINTVHDSFATTAGDVATLRRVLLETLAELYQAHPLDALRQELESRHSETLPKPPKRGDLDPYEIRESDYAFS